ncbi:UNVERIFIED_CONTAM: hypothetical protein PYX00_000315 [Menopon gallinae]|uniref:Myb-like domain-containing protein n=1 Tax=Menopon gallinae TaxID=328185 RepID=A0AAW2I8G2_9NEOP
MTSTEASFTSKRVNDTSKKSSPLKVVSPIIKKYSGQRQGRIKKKLEFPRKKGKKAKATNQAKPALKTILPKTNAGDVVIVESELLPCALNIQPKRKREETDNVEEISKQVIVVSDDKISKVSSVKDGAIKISKSKISSSSKGKKYLKNIEATFALLKPQTEALREKREQAFAENYLQRVQQKLKGKDDALYTQFIDLICDFQKRGLSVLELYKRIKQMFSKYSDLDEDFVAFLTPQQAVECGVFLEHLLLTTMTDFLSMVDVYFSKSPQQVKKIHLALEKLSMRPSVTTDDVTNAILPLLKGNTVLQDYFLKLLPNGAPPNNFLTDFEEVEYPELNSDISEDEEHFEIVRVPEMEDVFGGDSCPCNCHNSEDEKFKTRNMHCTSCSVKFINGKIFIQQGKLLRPAKVTFEDHDMAFHRDRLVPKHYPSRGRKKTRMSIFKENLSPTKSCYLSSDEFKSDIEDDEKMKSKLGLNKSPRTIGKKIASPKNCDRSIARSIFNDTKIESVDSDDKTKCILDDKSWKDSHRESVCDPTSDICDVIKVESPVKEEVKVEVVPAKPLDLPLIDEEEPMFFAQDQVKTSEKEEHQVRVESTVLCGKDGSKSPPVISIPDSANPSLFPSGKPILSFLENLDSSKEPVLLINDSDAVINFDSSSDAARNEKEADKGETEEEAPAEEEKNKSPWKIEEDRVILQTLQVEENCEETFRKINDKIPSRSLEDIKKRFANLMNMLYEMKAKTNQTEGSN